MGYFDIASDKMTTSSLLIKKRLHRVFILNSTNIVCLVPGDIIAVVFWKAAIIYKFEGICIAVRNKSSRLLDTTLLLRNVIFRVGIESISSFFLNRVFRLSILDFKRKQLVYQRSKLYYLRKQLNRASRVKV